MGMHKTNIRARHLEIIGQYGLNKGIEGLSYVSAYGNLWGIYTADVPPGGVAIYGAGANTNALLKLLKLWNEIDKVGCIIDNNATGERSGIRIVKEIELDEEKIKMVWISSSRNRIEMSNSIKTRFPEMKRIEPCEILSKKLGLRVNMDISKCAGICKYKWFSNRLMERNNTTDTELKKKLTRELIAAYFCVYDWVSFYRELNLYLREEPDDKKKYISLKGDFLSFIHQIKVLLRDRQNRSCFIFLLDALSRFDANRMPYLCEWKKDALEFVDFRNEYPVTREVTLGMFTGWRPFEDMTYKKRVLTFEDSDFLKMAENNAIKIKYITENDHLWDNFTGINSYEAKYEENSVISEVLFNGICELTEDESSQIVVAHTYTTIHPPHMTPATMFIDYGGVSDPQKTHRKYFEEALLYTDELVHYYTELLDDCDSITQIIMGDHGINIDMEYCYLINPSPYPNKAAQWDIKIMSPALVIKDRSIMPGTEERIVSTNQFVDILYKIIKGQDPQKTLDYKGVIPIEMVPGYDKNWIMLGVNSKNYYLAIAAKGCMNKRYMYLNLETGIDLYYLIENESIIPIHDSEKQLMIKNELGIDVNNNCLFPKGILKDPLFDIHNSFYYENDSVWE